MPNPDRLEHIMNRMLGTETEWELDELHSKLNRAVVNKEGFDAIEALFQECMSRPGSDGECMVCGVILCPHHEPLHYHHDGCPACEQDPLGANTFDVTFDSKPSSNDEFLQLRSCAKLG